MAKRYEVSHDAGRWQVTCYECGSLLGNLPDKSATDNWIGALIKKHQIEFHPRLSSVSLSFGDNEAEDHSRCHAPPSE